MCQAELNFEPSSVTNNFERLTGKALTSEASERIGRLVNVFGAKAYEEYQMLILPLESYLMEFKREFSNIDEQAKKQIALIEQLVCETQELINTRTMIDEVQKALSTTDSFAALAGKIQENARMIEEHLNSGCSSVNLINNIAEEAKDRGDQLTIALRALPEKLEMELSERISEMVERKLDENRISASWMKVVGMTTFFLIAFGFFGTVFFVSGFLSHGAGLPKWILLTASDKFELWDLARAFFGLPMSWIIFMGAALLAGVFLFERYKNYTKSSFWKFMRSHKLSVSLVILGGIIAYYLYGWFI